MDTAADKYWVIGGLYTDTDFKTLVDGTELEEYGPFDTHNEAEDEGQARSKRKVDLCYCCYRIFVDITLDISLSDRKFIAQQAKQNGMTESEWMNDLLERHIRQYNEDHPFTREDFMEISD